MTADTIDTPQGATPTVSYGSILPISSQYASSVISFSSQYDTTSWSANQALGAPNTTTYGDNSSAWAALLANNTTPEYLTLGFTTPVYATGLTIRETYGNGFVSKVEVRDTGGVFHEVWAGTDTSAQGNPVDFAVTFPQTSYLVDAVRVTINPSASTSWEEIDSVQLHGNTVPDTIPPTVPLTSTSAATVNAPFAVTATFSESTTNFAASDISITNGTVSGFSSSGTTYSFTVTPTHQSTVTVNGSSYHEINTQITGSNATWQTRDGNEWEVYSAEISPSNVLG
jgi:hypothetical protein